MSTQISLKLSPKLYETAKNHSENFGYESLQDFIRETIRQKLFDETRITGKELYALSEKSLAKEWLTLEEDKAWEHLQSEM